MTAARHAFRMTGYELVNASIRIKQHLKSLAAVPLLMTIIAMTVMACDMSVLQPEPMMPTGGSKPVADVAAFDASNAGVGGHDRSIRRHAVPKPSPESIMRRAKETAATQAAAQEQADLKAKQDAWNRWNNPSGGTYPDIGNAANLNIVVSLAEQRTYIRDGDRVLYTMLSSTGMDDSTPHGDYTIGMRGHDFYNPRERMGANWWIGFIGGEYLFHSVPTDVNGAYIESEAVKLGQPASHGCVRLTVADAKWFHDMIPSGTPVHIG